MAKEQQQIKKDYYEIRWLVHYVHAEEEVKNAGCQ